MYNAIDIVAYILNWNFNKYYDISNLRLQWLLYILQCRFYQIYHIHFISQYFYCWKCGPVIPEIYYKYCAYGGLPIRKKEESTHDFSADIVAVLDNFLEEFAPCVEKCNFWNMVNKTFHYQEISKDIPYKCPIPFYNLIKYLN